MKVTLPSEKSTILKFEQGFKNTNYVEKQDYQSATIEVRNCYNTVTGVVDRPIMEVRLEQTYPSGRSATMFGSLSFTADEARTLGTHLVAMADESDQAKPKNLVARVTLVNIETNYQTSGTFYGTDRYSVVSQAFRDLTDWDQYHDDQAFKVLSWELVDGRSWAARD